MLSLVTAAVLLVPASPAMAKTTVKAKGGVVTIIVKVDVYGGEGQTGPNGQPLDEYWEQIVQDTWGQAFDRLPYKNCYKFKLKVDIRLRSRDADDRDGWHRVHVKAPRTGNDWTDVGWANVPETSRDPNTNDGQRSFENDQVGEIPVNAPPTVVAHEFGHVFGLGDDRKNGVAKPGRDGTLMVGGARGVDPNQPLRIDQNLIDRIGKLIEQRLKNEGKKFPDCESWQGTMRSDTADSAVRPSLGPGACTGSWETDLAFTVTKNRQISGTAHAVATSGPDCTHPLGYATASVAEFTISGEASEDVLELRLDYVSSDGAIADGLLAVVGDACRGLPGLVGSGGGGPLQVPRAGPRGAGGDVTSTADCDYFDVEPVTNDLTAHSTIELRCTTCRGEAVG